jgi:hypothetical protein
MISIKAVMAPADPAFPKTLLKAPEKGVHSLRMPRSAINDSLWAKMTEAQKSDTVGAGRATLRQMVAGLLDGSAEVGRSCREFLTRLDVSLKELAFSEQPEQQDSTPPKESEPIKRQSTSDQSQHAVVAPTKRRRHGLPRGYSPRMHRRKRLV